jgi:hypothetical protein
MVPTPQFRKPFVTYNQTFKSTSYILAPATPTFLIPLNPIRRLLCIQNNGVNSVAIKFQTAPASAIDGVTLDGASVSGGQGGSILFSHDSPTTQGNCPVDALWAYSTLGTTVSIDEGTVYAFE